MGFLVLCNFCNRGAVVDREHAKMFVHTHNCSDSDDVTKIALGFHLKDEVDLYRYQGAAN